MRVDQDAGWCYTSDLSEFTDFYNVKVIRQVHIDRCYQHAHSLGGVRHMHLRISYRPGAWQLCRVCCCCILQLLRQCQIHLQVINHDIALHVVCRIYGYAERCSGLGSRQIWPGTSRHVNRVLRHQPGVRIHLFKVHCL